MIGLNLNKKTSSTIYSITIRTGNGLILGSKPVNDLFTYIRKNFEFFIFSVEMDNDKAHFQGGVLSTSSKRQDNVKRDIQKFVDQMYIDGLDGKFPTEKGLYAMKKFALKVVPHNDFHISVRYVLKEGISYPNTPYQSSLPEELQYYVPEQYCQHDNVKFYCSNCYKEESDEVSVMIPPEYSLLFEEYPTLLKKWQNRIK